MIRNGLKQTISAISGFELLQMVSKLGTSGLTTRMLGLQGGWIMRSHIGWREERNIPYKGVDTSP